VSVLIVAGDPDVDGRLARRLVTEGDVVGIIVEDQATAELLDQTGAHLAVGSRSDEDLIERAASHARTIVVSGDAAQRDPEIVSAVIDAARRLEDVRIVVWGRDPSRGTFEMLRDSGLPYVVLRTGKLRGRLRKTLPLEAVVEAIDAADDLAGEVRLEVDLQRPEGWARLKLEPPG
jgi:hypothetical protein